MKNVLRTNITMKGFILLSIVQLVTCQTPSALNVFKPSDAVDRVGGDAVDRVGGDAVDRVGVGKKADDLLKLDDKEESARVDRSIDIGSADKKRNDWERFLEPPYMPAKSKIGDVRELYNAIIREEIEEPEELKIDTAPWTPMSHKGHHHNDHHPVKQEKPQKIKKDVRVKKETKPKKDAKKIKPLVKKPSVVKPLPRAVKPTNLRRPAVAPPKKAPQFLKRPQAAPLKAQRPNVGQKKVNNLPHPKPVPQKNLKPGRPLSKTSKKHLKQVIAGKHTRPVTQRASKRQQQNNLTQQKHKHSQPQQQHKHSKHAHPAPVQHHTAEKQAVNFRNARARPAPRKQALAAKQAKLAAAKVQGRNFTARPKVRTSPVAGRRLLPSGRSLKRTPNKNTRRPIRSRKVTPRKSTANRKSARTGKKTKFEFKPINKRDATALGVGTVLVGSLLAL